jgi:Mg2+ and Co2+ transporter CorA
VYDRGEHVVKEGFLIHRMFDTRYYLMAVVALFYRATMLDFAQKTALVSRRLFRDQEAGQLSRVNIESATRLRSEFLHFSNYWYFEELANKDEEIEHFTMQCRAYRVGAMKSEVEQEIEKLNASLHEYHQARSTEAVNRLAMLSMILGAGAVLTGFFGMNFGMDFERLFFNPDPQNAWLHYLAIAIVSGMAFGALAFGVYIVMANPADYRDILTPRRLQADHKPKWYSLKKSDS